MRDHASYCGGRTRCLKGAKRCAHSGSGRGKPCKATACKPARVFLCIVVRVQLSLVVLSPEGAFKKYVLQFKGVQNGPRGYDRVTLRAFWRRAAYGFLECQREFESSARWCRGRAAGKAAGARRPSAAWHKKVGPWIRKPPARSQPLGAPHGRGASNELSAVSASVDARFISGLGCVESLALDLGGGRHA